MRKTLLFIILVGTLILSACSPTTPVPTPTEVPTLEPTPVPSPTAAPASQNTPAAVAAEDCQVVTMLPDPEPMDATLFEGISEEDHALGPDDAAVTILEYSDYQ